MKKIHGWKEADPGNAVYAYEKGDWAISLTRPDDYNPNSEVRIINFRTGERMTILGSPSLLLKEDRAKVIRIAEKHIARRKLEKLS